MLVDETEITVSGGNGGNGVVSFYPMRKGPDGGDGGQGGSAYAVVNPQLTGLHKIAEKRTFKAGNGMPGASYRKKGSGGRDLIIEFPIGTVLIDKKISREFELFELSRPLLLCRGGKGGRGNNAFKSSTHRVPREWEPGAEGEKKEFKVIMRLIADIGLIGLPNAGKSSLLNILTAAHAKIAAYPFTTLEPNLGVIGNKVIADIPGLIEGASTGKGLGIRFLKHIEKVSLLLHCVAADSQTMDRDYMIVLDEMKSFNQDLLKKNQIILLTKSDLVNKNELLKKKKTLEKYNKKVLIVSIYNEEELKKLTEFLLTF